MAEPAYTVEVHEIEEIDATTPPAHPGTHYSLAAAASSPKRMTTIAGPAFWPRPKSAPSDSSIIAGWKRSDTTPK